MVTYDPKIIQTFADRLYSRAKSIAAVYTVLGLLIGGVAGFLIAAGMNVRSPLPAAVVGAVILGLICLMLGIARGFALRLVAQQALCQVQIEANTRESAAVPV